MAKWNKKQGRKEEKKDKKKERIEHPCTGCPRNAATNVTKSDDVKRMRSVMYTFDDQESTSGV